MNEEAEIKPIEVVFTVMTTILTMGLLIMVVGPFVDGFMNVINSLDFPLSIWGQNMMNILPVRMAKFVFYVPVFFILLILIWGIKTAIQSHQYTTKQDPKKRFMNDDNY